jgi:polyisoprenoid-binding protein YceI
MPIPTGSYTLGPDNAQLFLHTRRDGLAASMGHDLTLDVRQWTAELSVGEGLGATTLSVTADLRSLTVVEGRGGAMPLTDDNCREIEKNAAKALDAHRHPDVRFTSSALVGSWDEGRIAGTLALHGQSQPQDLALDQPEPGVWRVRGTVTQSRFGIKPFSAFLGALKIRDEVDVEVTVGFDA